MRTCGLPCNPPSLGASTKDAALTGEPDHLDVFDLIWAVGEIKPPPLARMMLWLLARFG